MSDRVRLYGHARSRAFRCLWLLEELGLEYDHVPLRWDRPEIRDADYLAVNPNGRVPALVDGDLVVWESLAINHYLVDRYGGPDWRPATPAEAGERYRWSFWAMGELEGPIDAVARAQAKLAPDWAARPLGVLEQALAGRSWLCGERFSLADLNVAVMFVRPVLARESLDVYPCVDAWKARCLARPAFRRVVAPGEND